MSSNNSIGKEEQQQHLRSADLSERKAKQTSSVVSQCGGSAGDTSTVVGETFGSRLLSSDSNVFEHNAWDHVQPDEQHFEYAAQQIHLHHEHPVPENERERYNQDPAAFWDDFYTNNQNKFFKDRRWLRIEFPELFQWTNNRQSYSADSDDLGLANSLTGKFKIMEVGCGAGNAVFPLLSDIHDERLFIYACDYSKTAVDVVKSNELYTENRCKAFVWDLSSVDLPAEVEEDSLDILLMVYVFSALHPSQWSQAVENAYRLLKSGGVLLFRDYGRNDMTQLRFKKGRLLEDNFYIRGDGTRVYFFTNQQLAEIFGDKFSIEQNAIDRRMLVNRKRELKMYRVWLQAKFRKI